MVFSEAVSDFATGDVTLGGTAGATTATVTGSGTTYNVAVSGMTGSGTVIASLAAGVAHDGSGNANLASTSTDNTVTYDVTPPTVTINQAAGQADPTNASPINFTVVFSEPVNDFATGDVTLSGTAGATTATVTGSGTTYNVAVSGMTGSGTVIASLAAGVAHDAAGNANTASTSTDNTVTYDVLRADGDHQPGGGPGGPDQRFADQLHGGLQRGGERLCHGRRDAQRHGGGDHGDGHRQRHDLQRGGQRDDRQRHGDCQPCGGGGPRRGGECQHGLHQHRQHCHLHCHVGW